MTGFGVPEQAAPIAATAPPTRSSPWIAGAIAAMLSAVLLVFAFLLYHVGLHWGAPREPILWQGKDLKVLVGQGTRDGSALQLVPATPGKGSGVLARGRSLSAAQYPFLVLRGAGLAMGAKVVLAWRSSTAPTQFHSKRLTWSGDVLRVFLGGEPDWSGTVLDVGLAVPAPAAPLRLDSLTLQAPSAAALLGQVWFDWSAFAGWTQRSINFIEGGTLHPILRPVPAVAAWVAVTLLLYGVGAKLRRAPRDLSVVAAVFLLGWIFLDVRWQWDLWRQLRQTQERFAGKSWVEKRLAAEDGDLFAFAMEIKKRLPREPQRIFLLSAEPQGRERYLVLRTFYHLLPHNAFVESAFPAHLKWARRGDYILVINPGPTLSYDPRALRLTWDGGKSLPAQGLYDAPLGRLYQVQ
jgi:hypothetical protein